MDRKEKVFVVKNISHLKEKYNFTLIKERLTTNYNSLHLLFKF